MGKKIISPQKGPQTLFLSSPADIAIYGGAAGGGKTWSLLIEPLRHIRNKDFGAVIFRHQSVQITNEGGLWDESNKIYPYIEGTTTRKTPRLMWVFKSGARITFSHIERDEDVHGWQGSQIPLIEFDELTHFSRYVFFYMLSRNRSTCGVKPYVRAGCNPDPDSWVAEFISWWIDQDTGYPIPERSGVIRWMIRRNDIIHWADTKEQLVEQFNLQTEEELEEPKSVTFVRALLSDNQELLRVNPQYRANLMALPEVERERLLYGNWKIKPAAGLYFKRTQLGGILPVLPGDVETWVRGWDLAATTDAEGGDPAYTAGVLIGKRRNGRYIVADVINVRQSAGDVRKTILLTAQADIAKYKRVRTRLPQDPGQAGKDQAQSFIKLLSGFDVKAERETGSKETRAEPVAAQWQGGNFDLLAGEWNEAYLSQLESFPESKFKDMVDATSAAFNEIETGNIFNLANLIN